MKKIILICIILISLSFFTACDDISEIENKSIVTACVAIDGEKTKYGFYISVPSGSEGGDEEGAKSGAKYYEFEANSFNSALKNFKESVSDDVDTAHMNLFAANEAYYRNKFSGDEKHISEAISTAALVDVCMLLCDEYALFDCIGGEYNSKVSEFSESILADFEMNLSKLSLAVHNNKYTAKIPVVCLGEHGKAKLPEVCSMSYYNSAKGIDVVSVNEYKELKSKEYLAENSSYDIKIKSGICTVFLNDKSIADIAEKYAKENTDILNIAYYGKKEFLYYDDYFEFFDKLDLNNVIFMGDKK